MAVSLVELNGMIGRTQDYSSIKQNEDNKAMVDQANIHVQQNKKEEKNANTVCESEKGTPNENRADAREKGNGTYAGDGGRNRKKQVPQQGRVIKKGQSHFDMTI